MVTTFTQRLSGSHFKALLTKNKPTTYIITRHPFDRLVSAFRDKLERHKPPPVNDWYLKNYGKHIVSEFREKALQHLGKDFFSSDNNFGAPIKVNGNRTVDLPTFWEFVQYVKKTPHQRMDEHWRPANNYCSLCTISYDYYIKFENFDEEGKYLKTLLEPLNGIDSSELALNVNPTGLKKEDLTQLYFSTLSESDVMALYKIYENDFKMFGYEFQFRALKLPLP